MNRMIAVVFLFLLAQNIYSGGCVEGDCGNGREVFSFANGDRYDGDWKNNMFDGEGTFKYSNGRVISGKWQRNEYIGE